MDRRVALAALAALVVVAGMSVFVASRRDPVTIGAGADGPVENLPVVAAEVPSLEGNRGWLNSAPLSPAQLSGKVVIYDFWTYSCINCIRTLPHLRALYDRYHAEGLQIIGIHSPEFEFEHDHTNVARAVKDLGVTWPVLFDDDMKVWRNFANQYWPAEYVADIQGRIRAVHFGEGDYTRKEQEVRALLGVAATTPLADAGAVDPKYTAAITKELHLGTDFGAAFDATDANYATGAAPQNGPAEVPEDHFDLDGRWRISGQAATTAAAGDSLRLRYRAGEVNVVLGLAPGTAGPVTVVVTLDGQPVAPAARTARIRTDEQNRTVFDLTDDDLVAVVAHGPSGFHTLAFEMPAAGVEAYAFTFGP